MTVIIFCTLLILGIISGQAFNLTSIHEGLTFITSLCLAYIMIEVGLEFSVEQRSFRSYSWDSVVSVSAAVLPALFWFIYFVMAIKNPWQGSIISGLSCAPTSAGVLFSMMMAAGLSATWVFKKARVLAVLDDLATILLLIPLQIMIHGFAWETVIILFLIGGFLFVAFRFKNTIHCPISSQWLLLYALVLTLLVYFIKKTTNIHLEVLIPAFMWGCIIYFSPQKREQQTSTPYLSLDFIVKGGFMFLVGLSFPKISISDIPLGVTVTHILVLTILSNLGKCVPFLCYRQEASFQERLALSIAMFPRGEVGAAVLLIGLEYGFGGYVSTLAMLSLAFNLISTGLFVWIILKLLKTKHPKSILTTLTRCTT